MLRALISLFCCLTVAFAAAQRQNPQRPAVPDDDRDQLLREFLASRNALLPPPKFQMAPAFEQMIKTGLSRLPACGIRSATDNPEFVSRRELNTFMVDFRHPAGTFCSDPATRDLCHLLANNCVTIGSSVFCDIGYLERLEHIARIALTNAWEGVRAGRRDGSGRIFWLPITTAMLIDLGRLQAEIDRGGDVRALAEKQMFLEIPFAVAMETIAESNLLEMLDHMPVNLVLAHELAHVEQNVCSPEILSPTFLEQSWLSVHEQLTCARGSISGSEAAADARAVTFFLHALDSDLYELSRRGGGFSDQLSGDFRRDLEKLLPHARTLAALTAMHLLEYELFVHLDAEGGLNTLQRTPPPSEGRTALREYLIREGAKTTFPTARHLDPALRVLFLLDAIDVRRTVAGDRSSFILWGERLAPFIVGRLSELHRRRCGGTNDGIIPLLVERVATIFGHAPAPVMPTWVWNHGSAGSASVVGLTRQSRGGFALFGDATDDRLQLSWQGVVRGRWSVRMWHLDDTGRLVGTRDIAAGRSRVQDVVATRDGGFLIAAEEFSEREVEVGGIRVAARTDARLIRLDASGQVIWNVMLPFHDAYTEHRPVDVTHTPDGGFAVAGVGRAIGGPPQQAWIARVSNEGRLLWQREYGTPAVDNVLQAILPTENGFIVSGATADSPIRWKQWLLGLNTVGEIQWQKDLERRGNADFSPDFIGRLLKTRDSGFLAVGSANMEYQEDRTRIIRFDRAGRMVWDRLYGEGGDVASGTVAQLLDGAFVLAATRDHDGGRWAEAWVARIESDGRVTWARAYGGAGGISVVDVVATDDNGFALAGEMGPMLRRAPWVLRADARGDVTSVMGEFANSLRLTARR